MNRTFFRLCAVTIFVCHILSCDRSTVGQIGEAVQETPVPIGVSFAQNKPEPGADRYRLDANQTDDLKRLMLNDRRFYFRWVVPSQVPLNIYMPDGEFLIKTGTLDNSAPARFIGGTGSWYVVDREGLDAFVVHKSQIGEFSVRFLALPGGVVVRENPNANARILESVAYPALFLDQEATDPMPNGWTKVLTTSGTSGYAETAGIVQFDAERYLGYNNSFELDVRNFTAPVPFPVYDSVPAVVVSNEMSQSGHAPPVSDKPKRVGVVTAGTRVFVPAHYVDKAGLEPGHPNAVWFEVYSSAGHWGYAPGGELHFADDFAQDTVFLASHPEIATRIGPVLRIPLGKLKPLLYFDSLIASKNLSYTWIKQDLKASETLVLGQSGYEWYEEGLLHRRTGATLRLSQFEAHPAQIVASPDGKTIAVWYWPEAAKSLRMIAVALDGTYRDDEVTITLAPGYSSGDGEPTVSWQTATILLVRWDDSTFLEVSPSGKQGAWTGMQTKR